MTNAGWYFNGMNMINKYAYTDHLYDSSTYNLAIQIYDVFAVSYTNTPYAVHNTTPTSRQQNRTRNRREIWHDLDKGRSHEPLTHWGRETHICVSERCDHCFRYRLVAWPASSHYLNQCWNIVDWTLRNKIQWNLNRNSCIFIEWNAFENVVWEMAAILSRPQCVIVWLQSPCTHIGLPSYRLCHRALDQIWMAHSVAFPYLFIAISTFVSVFVGVVVLCFITLRPRQNGRHFPDAIFKWIFLNENVSISIDISLEFVTRGPINNIPTLVQVMAWRRPLSEPMMLEYRRIYASLGLNEICVCLFCDRPITKT